MRKMILTVSALAVGLATATHVAASPAGTAPRFNPSDSGMTLPAGPMPEAVKAFLDAHPVPEAAAQHALAKHEGARLMRADDRFGGRSARLDAVRSVRADGPAETYMWTIDDFDTSAVPDPSLWTMLDLDEGSFGDYQWNLSQCRAANGTQSLWAVGGGNDGSRLTCEDLYPSGVNSSAMLALDFSRFGTPPSQVDLLFDFWLNTRIFEEGGVVPDGLFVSYLMPRENQPRERVVLAAVTSQYPERFFADPMRLDLLQAREVYPPYREVDLTQDMSPLIEFLFMSRDPKANEPMPTTFMGGAFIDNVRIETDVMPAMRAFDLGAMIEPRFSTD